MSTRFFSFLPGDKHHHAHDDKENARHRLDDVRRKAAGEHGTEQDGKESTTYQGEGGAEKYRPAGLSVGRKTEGGKLRLVAQFRQEDKTEGCKQGLEINGQLLEAFSGQGRINRL